jgi:WD40 repeat protein
MFSFAEDNRTIVTGSLDQKVKLWDIETGKELYAFNTKVDVWSVDLISDASIIVLGCNDGTVRFLVNNTGKTKNKFTKLSHLNEKILFSLFNQQKIK